eukprot:351121-Chlamydomonas_euryale.AAC.3
MTHKLSTFRLKPVSIGAIVRVKPGTVGVYTARHAWQRESGSHSLLHSCGYKRTQSHRCVTASISSGARG